MDEYKQFVATLESIISEYSDSENNLQNVRQMLEQVKNRVDDDTLYLGAVGAFSSGKSTFINSVIQKNLLPTDAIQGTTVSATILKKEARDDLEVVYTDGSTRKYYDDKRYFVDKYHLMSEEKRESIWKKILNWIKRLFGLLPKIDKNAIMMRQLFLKLITDEQAAQDIEKVILHVNNQNIKYNIGLVDTPGIESLNERHNEVTKNAIDNICDALVVIIPYDEPVSEELIGYINANMRDYLDNCIFVVTKVELLDDLSELSRLIKVITKRLSNGLDIQNPIVLPMPTLMYLKNVDLDTDIKLLDDISEESKTYLLDLYEKGLQKIYEILVSKREGVIKSKLIAICEQVSMTLVNFLEERVEYHENFEQELISKIVRGLPEFAEETDKIIKNNEKQFKDVTSKNVFLVSEAFEAFEENIANKINEQNEIDSIVESITCITETEAADEMKRICQDCIEQMKKAEKEVYILVEGDFKTEYAKCGNLVLSSYENQSFASIHINDYVSDLKERFNIRRDNTAQLIKEKKSGLVGKFKLMFSKNIQKEKEIAIKDLLEFLDDERDKAIDWYKEINNQLVCLATEHISSNVSVLIKNNEPIVDLYCREINQHIGENGNRLKKTTNNINTVNIYLRELKEGNK